MYRKRNRKDGIVFSGDSVVFGNHASDNGKGGAAAGFIKKWRELDLSCAFTVERSL